MKKSILLLFIFYCAFANAQEKIADNSVTSGTISYIVVEPDDSKLAFKGSSSTFYFLDLEDFSISNTAYTSFLEEEIAGDVIFGRGVLSTEVTDLTFVTTTEATHLDYYNINENFPRIFVQSSGGAYFGSGKFAPDGAGRDFIRLSNDLTTVTRPFNNVSGGGVDLINKNIYQVQMTPFGSNKILVKAKRTAADEEYFVWDDTGATLTQLTDADNTAADATNAVNWPLAKAYGSNVVFFYNDQLFKSDGTALGTELISSVSISDLDAIGGADNYVLYGSEDAGDTELYLYTDGGTATKIDLNTGGSSFPTDFVSNGSLMMFIADDGTGYEPYISDGTVGGTMKLLDINSGGASMSASTAYNFQNIIAAGSGFVFSASDGSTTQLYYTDGENVVVLDNGDEYNGYSLGSREAMTATDDFVYFSDASANLFLVAIPDNIYDGAVWTEGAPQVDQSLYFTSDYTLASSLVIHSAHIPSGVTVTVPDGVTLEITSALHMQGAIDIQSGGTFIYNEAINTLDLQAITSEVETFLSIAEAGIGVGQYPSESLTALSDLVVTANALIDAADDANAIDEMSETLYETLIDVKWEEVQAEYVYANNLDIVIGDLKQAQILNSLSSKSQVDYLLLGMREARVIGVRIAIFADGLNPNVEMYDYFYEQAVERGFKVFANPAQHSGGQRIACGILDIDDICVVLDDATKTNALIDRITDFAAQYKCDWINPFNEDGSPGGAFSANQMNTIYSSLQNNLNGADLIGPCVWGIGGSISVIEETDVLDYVTVSSTHNLGFDHDLWDEFIALSGDLPVWDSEANVTPKDGYETRIQAAVDAGVDGMVYYNNWGTINLTDGSLNASGLEVRDIYSSLAGQVTGIVISGSTTLEVGEETTLTAEVSPIDAINAELTWSSSNEAVATVDGNGVVTGVSIGEVTITATAIDGSGTSATFAIAVGPILVSSITISGETTMSQGTTQTLTATVLPVDASSSAYSWSSSNVLIATIDANGLITARLVGSVTITATASDGSGVTSTMSIVITPQQVSSIELSGDAQMEVGGTQSLTTVILPVGITDDAIDWTSSDTSIATVNDEGMVTAVAAGTTTITATANDGSGITAQFEISVLTTILGLSKPIDFIVYPNPSRGLINVSLPDTELKLTYQLFNMTGQLIQSGDVPSSMEINIENKSKGLFNLIIKSSNRVYSSSLIIE